MIPKDILDKTYKELLEEKLIRYLAERKNLSLREAMSIYYNSRLSKQIAEGKYGIENLDYKYLIEDLIENEKELFEE